MRNDPRSIKESFVKMRVKKVLAKYGAYHFMPVQSGYGAAGLDFYCCHKGRFFSVETKRPGKHLTPRQELIKEAIEKAGGVVFVIGEAAVYEAVEDKNGLGIRKLDTFSGMEMLEGWLLLGV
ncbi:MAG TPA: hypothetical protein ENH62_05140 [Marinobacter sp.]|uniref:VRR-NUC domain-containing protein n=1 Tax=marine sediment metagenome TaxID=412755 RepID=A0A0F9PJ95_9ZZZZ|nr:hypothetical protein [Marinobacter sp.]